MLNGMKKAPAAVGAAHGGKGIDKRDKYTTRTPGGASAKRNRRAYGAGIVAGAAILLTCGALGFSPARAAPAAGGEGNGTEGSAGSALILRAPDFSPETVTLRMADDPEAAPVPLAATGEAAEIRVSISEADAQILAKLLWSSPLRNEDDKRRLCWLVFNRCDDERYGLFGATVESVVILREFPFYDRKAHVSDTNLRIAREELRRWALHKIGAVKERPLDAALVYAAFDGYTVRFSGRIEG